MKINRKILLSIVLALCLLITGQVAYSVAKYTWSRTETISIMAEYTEATEPEPKVVGQFHVKCTNISGNKVFSGANTTTFPIVDLGNGVYQVTMDLPNKDGRNYSNYIEFDNRMLVWGLDDDDEYLQLDDTEENGGYAGSIDQGSGKAPYKAFMSSDGGTYVIQFRFNYSISKEEYDGSWWFADSESDSGDSGDDDDSGSGWPSWGWPWSLNTSNVRNLSIESDEMGVYSRDAMPNLLLTLIPEEGYLLPENFTVTIGEDIYTIYTNGDNEYETMFFEVETATLYILGDILPTDGSEVIIDAAAVLAEGMSAEPTEEATEPTEETTESTEEPTEPTETATKPTEEATEPTETATKPTEEATEPTEAETEPTEEAAEPTEGETEPTEEVAEPTEAPTEELTEGSAELLTEVCTETPVSVPPMEEGGAE